MLLLEEEEGGLVLEVVEGEGGEARENEGEEFGEKGGKRRGIWVWCEEEGFAEQDV